jgi:Flp pilus assembly protein TadG
MGEEQSGQNPMNRLASSDRDSTCCTANRRVLGQAHGSRIFELIGQLRRDESGSYLIISALLMPVLIGIVGLATDVGLWTYTHQYMQSAADSGAVSAATAYAIDNTADLSIQANSVTSGYGFTNGVSGSSVSVFRPPQSGTYSTNTNAIEVIVSQPQARLFSRIISSQSVPVTAHAIAIGQNNGKGCVLALNKMASGAITAQGSNKTVLNGCSLFSNSSSSTSLTDGGSATISALSVGVVGGISGSSNITTTQGVTTGDAPTNDPYSNVSYPSYSGCNYNNLHTSATLTLNPGVFCNGFKLDAGANVTLNPGVYYLDRGNFDISGGATLTGTGVTLVFTSSTGSNYASAQINGGATVNLTAPTSGPTAGIVIFGDRNMPSGTSFSFNGGASQTLTGAIYLPNAAVTYGGGAGGSNGCTQLVADTVTLNGNANFALNCNGLTKPIINVTAHLVE